MTCVTTDVLIPSGPNKPAIKSHEGPLHPRVGNERKEVLFFILLIYSGFPRGKIMNYRNEPDVRRYIPDVNMHVHVSRWLNGRSESLVEDVRRFFRALDRKIGRELREYIVNEVKIEEPLKLKIERQAEDNVAAIVSGNPKYFRQVTRWVAHQAQIDEQKITLQIPGKKKQIPHYDCLHEVGHGIYRLMHAGYHAPFRKLFFEQSELVRARIEMGEDPIKVAKDVHSSETFLGPMEEIPAWLCWPGFVGKVDSPWGWELEALFHKDDNIPERKTAYAFLTDSEEAFCEFFAYYHTFNRSNHTLRPNPKYKNPFFKDFGDTYLENIIESAGRQSREERK